MIKPLMKFLPCLFGISFSSWSGLALSEVKKNEILPHRVVSMSLASDEILLDIMPACGGYDRIVALSTFSDQPQSSNVTETAKIIRGRVQSELETIINLNFCLAEVSLGRWTEIVVSQPPCQCPARWL